MLGRLPIWWLACLMDCLSGGLLAWWTARLVVGLLGGLPAWWFACSSSSLILKDRIPWIGILCSEKRILVIGNASRWDLSLFLCGKESCLSVPYKLWYMPGHLPWAKGQYFEANPLHKWGLLWWVYLSLIYLHEVGTFMVSHSIWRIVVYADSSP